jgi:uncharacterized protein YjbJ (UPF0337 family)
MINTDILENQWKELRGKVRERWRALSEDDVEFIDGHFDVLVELLREKYGYTKQQAEEEASRFIQSSSTKQEQAN